MIFRQWFVDLFFQYCVSFESYCWWLSVTFVRVTLLVCHLANSINLSSLSVHCGKQFKIMNEHPDIRCLSQLLIEKTKERSDFHDLPIFSWAEYFNSDYTFSEYKFRKKIKAKEDTSETKITAGCVRDELLCAMIKFHNVLFKDSDEYKGKLIYNYFIQCYLSASDFSSVRVGIFGLCTPSVN